MSTAFNRTVRTLGADGFRPSLLGVGAVLLLLTGWAAWCVLARVTLYEVSATPPSGSRWPPRSARQSKKKKKPASFYALLSERRKGR
jgi:hypothetical protein